LDYQEQSEEMIYRQCWQHLYDIERKRIPATPEGDLRLHRLERPVPWPDDIWPVAQHIERYPDYPPLIERWAAHLGVPKTRIVMGLGIEDLIRTLVLLCCDPGDGFAFTWPTCMMFEIYAKVFATKAVPITTHPDVLLTLDQVLQKVDEVKLLLLPNPGQPVETYFKLDDLRKIAEACHRAGAVFAIDEAYYGFGADTALPLIDEFDNVLVLRTFSKAYGAAGIRVGCALGQERLLQPLEAVRLSGELAGPSMVAATRLLVHWADIVEPGIKEICMGRDWLRMKLIKAGFTVDGHLANHVLLSLDRYVAATRLQDKLRSRGIQVKARFPKPLDGCVLITAGPMDLMETLFEAIMECQQNAVA
jgi:histidinol-phosphate/aromatic aminotransferase/cobyric acid decarboxylase-like protein